MKQKSQLTCVKISIVRLSDKIVSLNLYPFSEKIESHCAKWYSSRQKTNFALLSIVSRSVTQVNPSAIYSTEKLVLCI